MVVQYNLRRRNKLAHLESSPLSLDMVRQPGEAEGARKEISSRFYKILTKHYPEQRLSYNILHIWQEVRELTRCFSQGFWSNKCSLRIFLKYPKYSISLEPSQDCQMGQNSLIHLFNCSTNIYYEDAKNIHKRSQNRTKHVWGPDGIGKFARYSSWLLNPFGPNVEGSFWVT